MVIKKHINITDDKLLNGLGPVLDIINSIEHSDDDDIEIDFINTKFVSPLFLLPLMVFVIGHKKKIRYSNIPSYMNTVRFGTGLKPDEMIDDEFLNYIDKCKHKTYIPIVNFPAKAGDSVNRDAIITSIETIIAEQLSIEKNILIGLKYMIGEMVDNITQHAKSDRGYVFAQAYAYKKYIDICIADTGITLLGSYKDLPTIDIENDAEAIQAANRGISSKNLPNAENRGYGITSSKKMLIKGLGGSFVMISGNAIHVKNKTTDKFLILPQKIEWRGTIIALRIPYQNKDFNYINYVE